MQHDHYRRLRRALILAAAGFAAVMAAIWWSSYQGRVDLRDQIVHGCIVRNHVPLKEGRIVDCGRLYKHPTILQFK